jgi:hypothetical protein
LVLVAEALDRSLMTVPEIDDDESPNAVLHMSSVDPA